VAVCVLVVVEFAADVESTRSSPLRPDGPAGPAGPAGPVGPAGSEPARKSDLTSEPFSTLADVTAFAASFFVVTAEDLSWAGPTLFLGTARTVA
jgi:hypothetical protein